MKKDLAIDKVLKTLIIIIAIAILSFIVILNIRYEVTISIFEEHTNIQDMNILKLLLCIILGIVTVLITFVIKKLNISKKVKIITTILALGLYSFFQILWIKACLVKPGADPGMIYGTAKLLFNNQDIMKEHILEYFSFYKQNIGLVVIYERLMRFFNTDNVILFRYVNVVCNTITVLGLYWIYKMINDKEENNTLLFYVLILGFLPISLLSTWVYGDFIGLSLGILSVALIIKYVKSKKIRFLFFSSICMSIAIIARSNLLIFIIAITIYLIITLLKEKNRKERIVGILLIPLFIVISIIPNKILTNYISKKYQLDERKEKSIITYLYMGMSEGKMANGWYNDEIDNINNEMKKNNKDDNTIENQTKEKLSDRINYLLNNPLYTIWFYKYKILSMWAEPTMASEVYNSQRDVDMSENKIYNIVFDEQNFEAIKASQKVIDGMIFVGALSYIILKRKNISNEVLLVILIFLGGFGFHILWEAKSRYIIPYVVILIPVATKGLNELCIYFINKRNKEKNEKKEGCIDEKNKYNHTSIQ